jgi:hypothetical protein
MKPKSNAFGNLTLLCPINVALVAALHHLLLVEK